MAAKCHGSSKIKGGPDKKTACEFNKADAKTGILKGKGKK